MAKIKMLIEVEYDADTTHSGDKDMQAKRWFMEHVLLGKGEDSELLLHSNLIGDTIGEVKVLEVYPF